MDQAQKGAGGDAHWETKGPARNSRSFCLGTFGSPSSFRPCRRFFTPFLHRCAALVSIFFPRSLFSGSLMQIRKGCDARALKYRRLLCNDNGRHACKQKLKPKERRKTNVSYCSFLVRTRRPARRWLTTICRLCHLLLLSLRRSSPCLVFCDLSLARNIYVSAIRSAMSGANENIASKNVRIVWTQKKYKYRTSIYSLSKYKFTRNIYIRNLISHIYHGYFSIIFYCKLGFNYLKKNK